MWTDEARRASAEARAKGKNTGPTIPGTSITPIEKYNAAVQSQHEAILQREGSAYNKNREANMRGMAGSSGAHNPSEHIGSEHNAQ